MKPIKFKKPYPLYFQGIKVCQDCGYLENCHGVSPQEKWKHLFQHPDYFFL
jgi:hypothetical protein